MRKIMLKTNKSPFLLIPALICAGLLLLFSTCAVVADEQIESGQYEVRSNVENASVYFDGEFVGNILKGSLIVPAETSNRPVHHELMIEAPGYTTYNETVLQAPKPGKNNVLRGTLTLLPPERTGTLSLAVSPTGGEVFIDGVTRSFVDQSGILVLRDIPAGYRAVQIRLSGYQDWYERINVEANMVTKIRVSLTRITTGSLQVSSEPSSANVLINGTTVGITPVTIPDLAAGEVEIMLTLPGYQDWGAKTTVIPGQTAPVFGTLMPVVVSTPEPVNMTPEETQAPEPTQSPFGVFVVVGALALASLYRKTG